jgi:hypothetical protein
MNVEKLRKFEADKLRLDLVRTQNAQERDQETLRILPRLGLQPAIQAEKRDEISARILARQDTIFNTENRIAEILSGKYDEEFLAGVKRDTATYGEKLQAYQKKKIIIAEEDELKRQKLENRPKEKETKYIEKDYKYFWKVYQKICDSIPDYMREKLRNMPNNKGYIWRGCHVFGNLPPEPGKNVTLFEKRGQLMRIHEITSGEYLIYEKYGKERKNLVQKKRRIQHKLSKNSFSV